MTDAPIYNALAGTCRSRRRSWLFVPGDSERKIAKALASAADIVILDLEDAVAPANKATARRIVVDVLEGERCRPLAIRVNAADTDWYLDDVGCIGGLRPDVVVLPKCDDVAAVRRLSDQLAVLEARSGSPIGGIGILPLVTETAASLKSMSYSDAGDRLCGLGFAGEDLAADLGVEGRDGANLHPLLAQARNAVAIASAAARVPAIDTPFPDPRDVAGLQHEAAAGARLGFAGKMCIHPDQIETIHEALRPSDERVGWARSVAAAFAGSPDKGVALLDGRMIDRAHLRLAERYLAAAGTLWESSSAQS